MAIDDSKDDKKAVAAVDEKKDQKVGRVSDYLQAPRKKRKSFVICALSGATQNLQSGIDAFIRSQFKGMGVSLPHSSEELVKNFGRQITLLVLDDEFLDLQTSMGLVADLKRRKGANRAPVLFLTRQPERLVRAYKQYLSVYHETDDYIDWHRSEITHIYSKIRNGLNNQFARKSRRFKVNLPLRFYMMSDDKMHRGRVIDMSVHGAVLRSENDEIFRDGEQMKLYIPVNGLLPRFQDDYLRISARVRRVFIAGSHAGISFEYVTEEMLLNITTFLTNIILTQGSSQGQVKILGSNGSLY